LLEPQAADAAGHKRAAGPLGAIDLLVWTKVPLPKNNFIVEYSNLDVPDHSQNQPRAVR
jgi:hypothetical protein